MLRELLGKPDGLCHGRGGHMHLFSRPHLAATSGIVGSSVPIGVGFALAARRLRSGSIALAYTGDGAMNQGMLLESLNLAAAWALPLLVVCIDNGWAITTRSEAVTGGDLVDRARAFGWAVERVDGTDVVKVHEQAGDLVGRVRHGRGPAFLYATCPRLDGHFLGDPLIEQSRHLTGDATRKTMGGVISAALKANGGAAGARVASMARMMGTMARARVGPSRDRHGDPMHAAARAMASRAEERQRIDAEVEQEVAAAIEAALAGGEVAHA